MTEIKENDELLATQDNTTITPKKSVRRAKSNRMGVEEVSKLILACLDQNKAEEIVRVPLKGLTDIADEMIIATGLSSRHVNAIGDYIMALMKEVGWKHANMEGQATADWVLVDAGDIMIHIFKPETRALYNLEKLWSMPRELNHDREELI